jgi:hypothetical protein
LVTTQVANPPTMNTGEGDRVVRAPATERVAGEGSRPGPQPRAQQRQAAGLLPFKRQEVYYYSAQNNYYGPRAARAEASVLVGCEGCGRKGHIVAQCNSRNHPNWNNQHAMISYKDSAIAQAIEHRVNGHLRSLPPEGVQWIPEDDVWIGGELLKSWIRTPYHRKQTATSAQGNRPDQDRGKSFHLDVIRGGTDVYPSVQGTVSSGLYD